MTRVTRVIRVTRLLGSQLHFQRLSRASPPSDRRPLRRREEILSSERTRVLEIRRKQAAPRGRAVSFKELVFFHIRML